MPGTSKTYIYHPMPAPGGLIICLSLYQLVVCIVKENGRTIEELVNECEAFCHTGRSSLERRDVKCLKNKEVAKRILMWSCKS